MSPCSKQPRALAFISHLNEGRRKAEADDEVSGHLPFDSPRIHARHFSYHRFSSDPSAPRAGDHQAGEEVGGTRLYPSHPRREKEAPGTTRELEGEQFLMMQREDSTPIGKEFAKIPVPKGYGSTSGQDLAPRLHPLKPFQTTRDADTDPRDRWRSSPRSARC